MVIQTTGRRVMIWKTLLSSSSTFIVNLLKMILLAFTEKLILWSLKGTDLTRELEQAGCVLLSHGLLSPRSKSTITWMREEHLASTINDYRYALEKGRASEHLQCIGSFR